MSADGAQRVQVGAELRRVRRRLGLSGMQVAAELGWSQSKVSRIEAGRLGTSLSDLSALLTLYGVAEEVRAELLTVAVSGDGLPGAWVVKAGGSPRRQGEVAAIEARVRSIRQYGALSVPGLLQAPSYTRAIAKAAGFTDVEDLVARRAERQALLRNDHAPAYCAVLDERALLRWPGDPSVMVDQRATLVELASLANVELRLLRGGGGATVVALAQFVIYDFSDAATPSVVLLEAQASDTYLSSAEDVAVYVRLLSALSAEALSPEESFRQLRSGQQAWAAK